MTHVVIPTSDPVFTLTFDEVLQLDISGFAGDDYLSLSLPEFPSTKLDLSKSFVDFTSNETGDFGIGPTDQIGFDQSDPALPGTDGDTEMRIPISLLSTIDKESLTGVRFRIYANADCTFRCLSIRACSEYWRYAPLDIDTLWQRVGLTPSTDGTVNQAFTFPSTTEAGWPRSFPVLFRTDNLTGAKDPRPIDMSVGAAFSTGSLDNATGRDDDTFNMVALYFRDIPTDDQIQLELNSLTQADLNVSEGQPDFGTAAYVSRTQEDLDIHSQLDLVGDEQFDIERLPDDSIRSWLEVKVKWCATAASNTVTILNADEVGYTFTNIALEASNPLDLDEGQYILLVDLKDDWIQVQIYGLDQVGNIDASNLVFDSGKIIDDTLIKRRKGRFGWWSQFVDGDAFLYSIKTRGLNFGELTTKEFQSITPIRGVSLYAGSTTDHELASEIASTSPDYMSITFDPVASATGRSYKITATPLKPLQGIVTNPFLIDDPDNLSISFDIKFPSSQVPGGGLSVFLLGAYNQIIPINVSSFSEDIWSQVKISLKDALLQTGRYQLVLMQTLPVVTTTWWLENLSVKTTAVKWSARSYASDAWNLAGDRWIPAGSTLNNLNGGIVFREPGNGLQVRGQALRQDAAIHDFKAIPQYATLGRLIWNDEAPDEGSAPSSLGIATSITDQTVQFTGSATDSDGSVTNYLWSFGDDAYDSGPIVSHTYERPGTYTTTLIVKDDFGNFSSTQRIVRV